MRFVFFGILSVVWQGVESSSSSALARSLRDSHNRNLSGTEKGSWGNNINTSPDSHDGYNSPVSGPTFGHGNTGTSSSGNNSPVGYSYPRHSDGENLANDVERKIAKQAAIDRLRGQSSPSKYDPFRKYGFA